LWKFQFLSHYSQYPNTSNWISFIKSLYSVVILSNYVQKYNESHCGVRNIRYMTRYAFSLSWLLALSLNLFKARLQNTKFTRGNSCAEENAIVITKSQIVFFFCVYTKGVALFQNHAVKFHRAICVSRKINQIG